VADNNNISSANLIFTNDNTAPTGGALQVNGGGGTSSSTTFPINTRTNYAEASASGLSSSVLTVQSQTYNGVTCGAAGSGGPFTSATVITGTTQPAGFQKGFCYLYTLTGTDNVGNSASITRTVIVTYNYTFTVSNPGNQVAGAAFGGVALQLQADGVNTTAYYGAAYTGSKAITFSGPANSPFGNAPSYPATVAFTNGAGTVGANSITLFKAASSALTATDSTPAITGTTTATFSVSAATQALVFGTACSSFDDKKNRATPTTITRGTDAYGNTVAVSGTPTVTLSGSNGSWSATVSFANGTATATGSVNWTNVNTAGVTASPTASATGFVAASCSYTTTT
jgi:hypothetical protein